MNHKMKLKDNLESTLRCHNHRILRLILRLEIIMMHLIIRI